MRIKPKNNLNILIKIFYLIILFKFMKYSSKIRRENLEKNKKNIFLIFEAMNYNKEKGKYKEKIF